jgi:hypothetical protein
LIGVPAWGLVGSLMGERLLVASAIALAILCSATGWLNASTGVSLSAVSTASMLALVFCILVGRSVEHSPRHISGPLLGHNRP